MRLKLGFIGGGRGSIAGHTHFIASQMDGKFEVTGGIFSSKKEKSKESAKFYGVKNFDSLESMIKEVDIVVVLLPTPDHFNMLLKLKEFNIPVICEKPLVSSIEEIKIIKQEYKNRFLALTYNYSGYPMVRELKEMVRQNYFGNIKNIIIEMPQESFFRPPKSVKYPQPWRLKDGEIPMIALDLGTHVHHLAYFLLEKEPIRVVADFNSLSKYGVIDDAKIMLKYDNNMVGFFSFSKTKLGDANSLKIEIYGDKASAKWEQNNSEILEISLNSGEKRLLNRGCDLHIANQKRYNRMTFGHPSGFIEAFGNLYYDIYDMYKNFKVGDIINGPYVYGAEHAYNGLKLLHNAKKSSTKGVWVETKDLQIFD